MALLYDPGAFMPETEADFDGASWLISWATGPWHLHDVEVGGTVLLVDAAAQRIVWQTEVTHTFSVPYESSRDLQNEIRRRWGIDTIVEDLVGGGFCIGWRARCVARLDREPRALRDGTISPEGEVLELTPGFLQSDHMTDNFRYRWAIDVEPEVWCTGKPAIGWFGPQER